MTSAPLVEFRKQPPLAPPGASPLLAAVLLAIELCTSPAQLAAWWDWPAHREARWCLSDAERALADAARVARAQSVAGR